MTTTNPADVVNIAAAVSGQVSKVFPNYDRAVRVLKDGKTIVVSVSTSNNTSTSSAQRHDDDGGTTDDDATTLDSFWPEDCPLSAEKKRSFFWQYYRSRGCQEYTAILAMVLKGLSDDGVTLTHNERTVVDILVLNTTEFDVADLLSSETSTVQVPNESDNTRNNDDHHVVLRVHDPITDVTVPVIATYETMDRLSDLGQSVCRRLGTHCPSNEDRKQWKNIRPKSYSGSVPHWWVAVVVEVEQQRHGVTATKSYEMVHLDICGAAYDAKALEMTKMRPGGSSTLVPLQVFCTPEYCLVPNDDKDLGHKFVMKAFLSKRCQGSDKQWGVIGDAAVLRDRIALQPKSIRHFRCYHRNDTSSIEVTPLATFIERAPLLVEGISSTTSMTRNIKMMKQSIQNDILQRLSIGSKIVVCNVQSKPELNGRSGVIKKSSKRGNASIGRVPVLIEGQKTPILLKPTCIQLPVQKHLPYRSLQEIRHEYDKEIDAEQQAIMKEVEETPMTDEQKSRAQSALHSSDPAVQKAISVIQTGQMSFTSLGDPEIKRGITMLLGPPLDVILPASLLQKLKNGVDLSNHPKADDAMKIINMMKAAKQRFAQDHPTLINADGSFPALEGSDMDRMLISIRTKIRSDKDLSFVFQRLEELGLYVNPAK